MKRLISITSRTIQYSCSNEHFEYQLQQHCDEDRIYKDKKKEKSNRYLAYFKQSNIFYLYHNDFYKKLDKQSFLFARELRIYVNQLNDNELEINFKCGYTLDDFIGIVLSSLIYLVIGFFIPVFGVLVLLIWIGVFFGLFWIKSKREISYIIENFLPKSAVLKV